MDWIDEKLDRIKSQGKLGFLGWVAGKALFSMGLGILLVSYFPGSAWISIGWALIVLSVVVSIPALKAVFGKRYL